MKTAIITHLNDKYIENCLLDFLPSAQKYHPDSKIIIVSVGLSEVHLNTLKQFDITIYEMPIVKSYDHTSKRLHWQNMARFLTLETDIDLFVIVDCGDVFFQDNVFNNNPLQEGIGVIEEDHPADLGWSLGRINQLPLPLQPTVINAVKNYFMVNGGGIYGYRKPFIDFCNKLQVLTDGPNIGEFFGLDQVYINYLTRTENNIQILPSTYNFIAQSTPYYIENDIVYEKANQQIIKLVHNAGGRVIPRIFNGKDINKQRGNTGR